MARLPTADDLGARPSPQSGGFAVRPAQTNLGQTVAQLGQDVSQFANALNTAKAEDALNRLKAEELGLQSAYTQLHGSQALDKGYDEFYRKHDMVSADIEDTLANEEQKRIYRAGAARSGQQYKAGALRHQIEQGERYKDDVIEGTIVTEADAVSRNYNKPELVVESLNRVEGTIDNLLPPEQALLKKQKAIPQMYASVVSNQLANGDYTGAIATYDLVRPQLGEHADTIGRAVQQAKITVEGMSEADRLRAEFGVIQGFEEAKKIKDPKVRAEAEQRLQQEATVLRMARDERDRAIGIDAYATVLNGDPTKPISEVLGPQRYSALLQTQPDMITKLESVQRQTLEGQGPQTVDSVYDYLNTMRMNEPQKFIRENMSKHIDSLNRSDFQFMLNNQDQLKKPPTEKVVEAGTEDDQLKGAFLDINAIGASKAKQRAEYDKAYRASKAQFITENKREPTYAERQKMMNDLKLPFSRPKTVFGFQYGTETKPNFKITDEESKNFSVPADFQQKVAQERKAAGLPPYTPQQMLNYYSYKNSK